MAVPSSGQLELSKIYNELEKDDYNRSSLFKLLNAIASA